MGCRWRTAGQIACRGNLCYKCNLLTLLEQLLQCHHKEVILNAGWENSSADVTIWINLSPSKAV